MNRVKNILLVISFMMLVSLFFISYYENYYLREPAFYSLKKEMVGGGQAKIRYYLSEILFDNNMGEPEEVEEGLPYQSPEIIGDNIYFLLSKDGILFVKNKEFSEGFGSCYIFLGKDVDRKTLFNYLRCIQKNILFEHLYLTESALLPAVYKMIKSNDRKYMLCR